jgi:hypothetical protein
VRQRQSTRGLVFWLWRRLEHGGGHALAAEAAVRGEHAEVPREMPTWGRNQSREARDEGERRHFHRRCAIGNHQAIPMIGSVKVIMRR